MKIGLSILGVLVLVVTSLVVFGAEAEELTARELKKLSKAADRAFKKGQVAEAAGLYQQLLEVTPRGDFRRANGLYRVARFRLASGFDGDENAARRYLDEIAQSFPRHPRRREVLVLRGLLDKLDEARQAAETARTELADRESALDEMNRTLEETQAEVMNESEEAEDRIESLRDQLKKTQAELDATREELEKKEEALERLLKLRSERGTG